MPLAPPQRFRKTENIHRMGLAVNRPAAADVLPGTLYFSTDTFLLERSDGAAWSSYSNSGAAPAAHHVSHETGGTDAIAALAGSVINSGTVADARLSSNVALKNIDNAFVAQTFSPGNFITGAASPGIYFNDTASAANSRVWRVINYGDGLLRFQALNDALAVVQGEPLYLYRNADVAVNGQIIGTTSVIPVAFNAGNFAGDTGAVWTVAAGNVTTYAYSVVKKVMTIFFNIVNTTVIAPVPTILAISIPGGFTAAREVITTFYANDNGVYQVGWAFVGAGGGTYVGLRRLGVAPTWNLSAGATDMRGQISFEVN